MSNKEKNDYILPVFIIVGCIIHIISKVLKNRHADDFVYDVIAQSIRCSLKEFIFLFVNFLIGNNYYNRPRRTSYVHYNSYNNKERGDRYYGKF